MFCSIGILRIEPKSKSTPLKPWWAILECCPDLGRYYLEQAKRAFWWHSGLQKPAWGPHVSFIRGEEPPAGLDSWRAMGDIEVPFLYTGKIKSDGKHFWTTVFCQPAEDIREKLGLPRQPEFPLHLTFAVAHG